MTLVHKINHKYYGIFVAIVKNKFYGSDDGQRPMGTFGQDAGVTLFRKTSWDF